MKEKISREEKKREKAFEAARRDIRRIAVMRENSDIARAQTGDSVADHMISRYGEEMEKIAQEAGFDLEDVLAGRDGVRKESPEKGLEEEARKNKEALHAQAKAEISLLETQYQNVRASMARPQDSYSRAAMETKLVRLEERIIETAKKNGIETSSILARLQGTTPEDMQKIGKAELDALEHELKTHKTKALYGDPDSREHYYQFEHRARKIVEKYGLDASHMQRFEVPELPPELEKEMTVPMAESALTNEEAKNAAANESAPEGKRNFSFKKLFGLTSKEEKLAKKRESERAQNLVAIGRYAERYDELKAQMKMPGSETHDLASVMENMKKSAKEAIMRLDPKDRTNADLGSIAFLIDDKNEKPASAGGAETQGKDERFTESVGETRMEKAKRLGRKVLNIFAFSTVALSSLRDNKGAATRTPEKQGTVISYEAPTDVRGMTSSLEKADEDAFMKAHTKLEAERKAHTVHASRKEVAGPTAPITLAHDTIAAIETRPQVLMPTHLDTLREARDTAHAEMMTPVSVDTATASAASAKPASADTIRRVVRKAKKPEGETIKKISSTRKAAKLAVAPTEAVPMTNIYVPNLPPLSDSLLKMDTVTTAATAASALEKTSIAPIETHSLNEIKTDSARSRKAPKLSDFKGLEDLVRKVDTAEKQKRDVKKAPATAEAATPAVQPEVPDFKPFPTDAVSPDSVANAASRAVTAASEKNTDPRKGKMTVEYTDESGASFNIDSLEKKLPRFVKRAQETRDSVKNAAEVAAAQPEIINRQIYNSFKEKIGKTDFFRAKTYESALQTITTMYQLDKVAGSWYMQTELQVPGNLDVGKNENIPQRVFETTGLRDIGARNDLTIMTSTLNYAAMSQEHFNVIVRSLLHEYIHAWQRSSIGMENHDERETIAHYFTMFPEEFSSWRRENYKPRDAQGNPTGEYQEITATFPNVDEQHMIQYAYDFEEYYAKLPPEKQEAYKPLFAHVQNFVDGIGAEKLYLYTARRVFYAAFPEELEAWKKQTGTAVEKTGTTKLETLPSAEVRIAAALRFEEMYSKLSAKDTATIEIRAMHQKAQETINAEMGTDDGDLDENETLP